MTMYTFLCRRLFKISFYRSIMTLSVQIIETERKHLNKFSIISSEMELLKMYAVMLLHVSFVKTRLSITTNSMMNCSCYQSLQTLETLHSKSSVLIELLIFLHSSETVRYSTVFSWLYAELSNMPCLFQLKMIQLLLILRSCFLNMLNAVLTLLKV